MVMFIPKNDPLILLTIFFSVFMSSFFILTFLKNKRRIGDPKLKKFRKVSILIAAYNEAETLAKTIENALNLDWPKDKIEIIVVENGGSTDGTYEIAKRYEKRGIKVLRREGGGKGAALNYAIGKSKGEIIVSMDADTYAKAGVLKKMLPYFDDPEVMIASPALVALKPKTFAQKVQNIEYLFGVFLRKVFHFIGSVYVTPGAFTAYRREFFDKHGGYDTTNITEDFELVLRAQSKGYKVTNSIAALVYTSTPKTFRALHMQRLRWFLGFIDTSLQHRSIFFNPKRGSLGVLILPTVILSIVLTLSIFIKLLWDVSGDLIHAVQNYSMAQSLDLLPLIYAIKFDLFYYQVNGLVLGTIILMLLGFYMFLSARKYSGDKESFAVGYMVYFLVYVLIFSFWWLHAIYFKFFGREFRFGGVVWKNSVLNRLLSRS